jgi:hypothetical protein
MKALIAALHRLLYPDTHVPAQAPFTPHPEHDPRPIEEQMRDFRARVRLSGVSGKATDNGVR